LEVASIIIKRLEENIVFLKSLLTPEHLENLIFSLLLAVAVLCITYLLIKLLYCLTDLVFKEGRTKEGEPVEQVAISDSMRQSVRTLLQTIILYGGYFIAAIIILDIFNVSIVSPEESINLGVQAAKVIGILIGAKLLVSISKLLIKQVFDQHGASRRRAQTLETLLLSVVTYLVFFVACLMILQVFNVNTSAILASAGILGLAIGFGAQNLVKDIISGFFILFEDQFSVGDYVQIDTVTGTVEEIGLRTCKIRQWTGELNVIPNGEISRVKNYTRGPMLAKITIGITYEADIDHAISVLQEVSEKAYREIDDIIDVPSVLGVSELAVTSVNILIIATTQAGKQWAVERELRKRFKNALEQAGIEMPFARQLVYPLSQDGK
jgi:small-conductance mechanosensitive channel